MDRNPDVTQTAIEPDAIETPSAEREPRRNPGWFRKGHPGPALKDGRRSLLLRRGQFQGEVDLVAEQKIELRAQQNIGDDILRGDLCDAFVEAGCVRRWYAGEIQKHGPLTAKGKSRAIVNGHREMSMLQANIAKQLGLSPNAREPKRINAAQGFDELAYELASLPAKELLARIEALAEHAREVVACEEEQAQRAEPEAPVTVIPIPEAK